MGKRRREGRSYSLATRKRRSNISVAGITKINYKDVELLESFITEKGKILPRRTTGISTKHQKQVCHAIKLARNIALLSFADGYVAENAPQQPEAELSAENAPAKKRRAAVADKEQAVAADQDLLDDNETSASEDEESQSQTEEE